MAIDEYDIEDFGEGTPAYNEKEYRKSLVEKYKNGEFTFEELIKKAKDNTGVYDDILLDNIDFFKTRIEIKALSQAVLDGDNIYSQETVERYLEAGLDKQILVEWHKWILPGDFFLNYAQDNDDWFPCPELVLAPCQIMKKYGISTEEIKSILDALPRHVKTFFYMVNQQDKWREIGINSKDYYDRCLAYIEYRCEHGPSFAFDYRILEDLETAPLDLRKEAVKKIIDSGAIKTGEIIKAFDTPSEAVESMEECGVSKIRLAKLLIRDLGCDYEKYSEKEIEYAYWLVPEAKSILDESKIEHLWRKKNPPGLSITDFINCCVADTGDWLID